MSLRAAARTHLHRAPLDNCEPAARGASRLVRSGDEILQPACERNRQQEALNLRRYSPNPRQFPCPSWVIFDRRSRYCPPGYFRFAPKSGHAANLVERHALRPLGIDSAVDLLESEKLGAQLAALQSQALDLVGEARQGRRHLVEQRVEVPGRHEDSETDQPPPPAGSRDGQSGGMVRRHWALASQAAARPRRPPWRCRSTARPRVPVSTPGR